ncbi:PREDICTED: uncharacterized protein LOC106746593 [Dinoponera quadriceps]|uniref:Uncharacterized protein LOC106746593 n=1 Tax=Dinoponera quadriceps TaxID=609295 RepID=A0A6P3XKA0_DINQU|nr:PREDICTED: uncharacterized protein LOC106746593 [Dinoponera quadriceps]
MNRGEPTREVRSNVNKSRFTHAKFRFHGNGAATGTNRHRMNFFVTLTYEARRIGRGRGREGRNNSASGSRNHSEEFLDAARTIRCSWPAFASFTGESPGLLSSSTRQRSLEAEGDLLVSRQDRASVAARRVRNVPETFELDELFLADVGCHRNHETRTTTRKMYEDCVLQSMRFPQKLWRIVNECKSGAIRWGANGDTILLDYKRFQTEYLDARRPIFKTTNITSFIRQLNLYGFRKVTYAQSRDPICNSHNPHVHEFLHDSFRADRADLLSRVCRKASGGKGKCFQHDAAKSAEDGPGMEANCVSRLKMCQLALTKTLEQITQEYRRKQEEKLTVVKNYNLDSQDKVADLQDAEFERVSNWSSTIEKSAKHSTLPSSTDALFERKMVSTWRVAAMDK